MKNFFFLFAVIILSTLPCTKSYSEELKNFDEYILENGLRIFVLEDFSSAPVRIEYSVRAGVNSQNADNAGFFPLYSKIFAHLNKSSPVWFTNNLSSVCTSDASRYVITVAPLQVETALENIAHCAFNPDFSDNTLSKNFYEMQKELGAYIASPASFINESIDSKIFTDEPWKQDSGTYPPLFAKTPMEKVRSNLSFIQKTYYTPNNSAIFISGSISKENALELSKKIFNSYQKHPDVIHTKPKMNHHEKRKFIIADKSFSADITQIVIQYTKISDINADIGANIFNAYSSSFKKNILQHQELKILGEDYIHVAATHRSGISRIIFQSLLEKSKLDAEKQAELFLSTTKKAADNIQNSEVNFIKNETISSYRSIFSSSSKIMEKLSELWALESILQETENITLSEKLNERPKKIESFSLENFCNEFNSEEPFVFVLVNSSVYQKRAKAFSSLGYELITQGNVSKEMQNLYKNASKESFQSVQNIEVDTNTSLQYIAQNKKQFEYRNLQNGIPIIFKQNFSSSTALVMISIKGGKLSTSSNHGFFSILINALAGNIQKEINKEKFNGNIKGEPSVKANTDLTSGTISVESLSEDLQNIIPCISRALIYGEVIAARADGLVYDEQTQKRLRDGDSANQMYSRAIYELYAGTPYTAIFDTDTDILVHTKYTDVLESYPSLLDASRYTVILTGNFNIDKTYETLTNTIALLSSQNLKNYTPVIEQPKFPKDKKILTKLRHVFLTDKSAEEAGPRPLVLIPTTNFSDPVQYWIASPAPYQKDFALFNALANLIATRVQNKIEKIFLDSSLKFDYATSAIQAVCMTFTKIEKVKQLDQIYEQVLKDISEELKNENNFLSLKNEILNTWILTHLDITQSNRGTALLIHDGIEESRKNAIEENAMQYILDYETVFLASQEELENVFTTFLQKLPPLRLYSKDAK